MSVTYGFYNSLNGDRKYDAIQMSKLFDGVLYDGVFSSEGTKFAVTASSGMTVTVGTGRAWFNHTWTLNDSPIPVTLDYPNVIMNRIDAIVIEVNQTASVRANAIKVVEGTAATNPVNPTLTNTDLIHQYPICYILVHANEASVSQGDITNNVGNSSCPLAGGIIPLTAEEKLDSAIQTATFGEFNCIKQMYSDGTPTSVHIPFGPFKMSDIPQLEGVDMLNSMFSQPGFFDCPSVSSGNPFGADVQFTLIVFYQYHEGMASLLHQVAIRKDTGEVKSRVFDATSGSGVWFPQYDNNSTNKHFAKFADGTMIEWGTITATATITQAYGSIYHNNDYVTLLNQFVGNVSGSVSIRTTGIVDAWGTYYDLSTHRLCFTLISPVSVSNLGINEIYLCIGRWK